MIHSLFRNLSLILLACFQLLATAVSAVELQPLACNDGGFVIQDVVAELFEADFDPVCTFQDDEINNMGFRSTDGVIYAIKLTPAGNQGIVRFDANCVGEMLGSPPGLPTDERFDAGDVSADGDTFYVHTGGSGRVYVVDLTPLSMAMPPELTDILDFAATHNVHDWAFQPDPDPAAAPASPKLFGGSTDGWLSILEIATASRTDVLVPGLPGGVAYGGARFNAAGELVLYRNSGEFFVLDVSDPAAPAVVDVGVGRPSARNDAASCPQQACDAAYVMQGVGANLYRTDTSDVGFAPPPPICGPVDTVQPPGQGWKRPDLFDPAVPEDVEFNNMCFHEGEQRIYALELHSGGNNGLVRIDPETCIVEPLGPVIGLPAGERFDAGDCWGDTMLINLGGVHSKFYRLDLGSLSAEPISIEKKVPRANYTGYVHDWAYNPDDGRLYGGDSSQGQLACLEIVSENGRWVGLRQDRNLVDTALPAGIAYGGAWFNAEGNLVLHRNGTGELFEIDVDSRTIIDEAVTPFDSGKNDGASCVSVPDP